jgi:eukaryotic-like serine/threonine-protein kinase
MNTPTEDDLQEDPRVMQIAREYLAELEAGRAPDRQKYLGRCPELAPALDECLGGIEMVHGAGLPRKPAPPPPAEPALGTLGDFLIVREIGRGGMGVVYEAIQISLNRMVALKVLPFAAALDAKHLQRFRNEAQAAAGLHHSHIVPVHAVGCERGVHFYAMQLIDGRPLDLVIREARGEAGAAPGGSTVDHLGGPTAIAPVSVRSVSRTGRGREGFRTVARLAADVADALEYAHQAGIVHRDVKPANLLLDGKGTIWVADFGLAHVNDVSLTRTGDVVGTLRYMSPEQASGSRTIVDHRADVYSLGATLYELITLQPMFAAQQRGALLNQILNEEPRPPRQLEKAIPAELETIVLKAVAKDPDDRYSSAGELAEDLRRYLDDVPIRARRPSLSERGRKWLRRHPSFVGAAVLLLAFSTAVLGLAVALVSREQGRANRAYAAEHEQRQQAQAAEAAERKRAKEAEERFLLAERVVTDLVEIAQEELRDKPGAENLRKQMMEMALTYHQEFIELHKGDPGAQARLGENRARVESILIDLIDKEALRRVALLNDNAVLDDLKLTPQERDEVGKLNEKLRQARDPVFKEFPLLSTEEKDRRFLELARAHEVAAAEVLSPEHLRRLRQIELQRQLPESFRRPDVVKNLKLTMTQRSRIRALIADPYAGKPPQEKDRWVADRKKRQAATEQIVALLTAEQAARWKDMTGTPFVSPPHPPFQHGRGHPDRKKGPFNK